jgi:hypothetical protein
MTIRITIETENDAFQDDFYGEVASVLERLKDHFWNEVAKPGTYILRDSNGNTCGGLVVDE